MSFAIRLTPDASTDLEEIYDWIAANDSPERAAHVQDRILDAIGSLTKLPERGAHPRELLALGIRQYRETFFKPYRIIYSIEDNCVDVYVIADGRRDMQSLLTHRLLAG